MLAASLLFPPPSAGAQGVTVALTPQWQIVQAGSGFSLDITVTKAGAKFNAFDAVVAHDPAALNMIPLVPDSLQQGKLMRDACPNTFQYFRHGASTDTIADALLCAGVALTGPGQIYHMQFRALNTEQVTEVVFLRGTMHFYNAGIYVTPVDSSGAEIVISNNPVTVPAPERENGRLGLRVVPNPAVAWTRIGFHIEGGSIGRITVVDPLGRLVRSLDASGSAEGIEWVTWDGRDTAGSRVSAGIYLVTVVAHGVCGSRRVLLLR